MNIPRASVNNPVAVNLLMWAIVLSGIYYWFTLVREFFPAISTEQISIVVPYPGATPEDVERAITLRIEREIRDIDGIDEIDSAVMEGMTVISVKLDKDANLDRVLNSVRSEIDQVKPEFPRTAEDPEIIEVRPYMPVISVVVSGKVPEERLRRLGQEIRDDLLDLEVLSEVNLIGIRNREIWAEVRPEKLEEYGLTYGEVGRAVAQGNLDMPGGQLRSDSGNVRIRTMGESRKAAQLEELVIDAGADGETVKLSDLATVRDTFEDRVMQGRFGGKPAVSLMVFKTPEQDALEIASRVKDYVARNKTRMGGAVTVNTTTDLSRFIDQRLDLMVRNARAGLILVVITLAVFLSLRTAFWVAVGLPVSLLGAFTVMSMLGVSINLLTLFSLIIVLGLIVDDAVVIGESVHTRIQEGMPPLEAAVKGATEVARPVLAAVITSVIAFAPLAFMEGVWGDFLGVIPIVVISALSISLIEAFIILPSHLGHVRRPRKGTAGPIRSFIERFGAARDHLLGDRLRDGFERLLRFLLRWRYATLAASFGLFLAITGLVAGGVVPFVLLQEVDAEAVTLNLEMAAGTSEARTLETVEQLEKMAFEYPEVKTAFTVLGASFSDRGQESNADPATVAQIYLELVAADERELAGMQSSTAIIDQMRARSLYLPGVDKLAFRAENGAVRGADVEVRVRSESLADASRAADHVRDLLLGFDGVTEIEKDLREGKLEARLSLKDSARSLELDTQGLARHLQDAVFGYEAQELQEEDDEVKVRVLLPENARRTLGDLGRLRVKTGNGGRVPLEEVADLHTDRGYSTLHRADGKRAVTIRAEVDESRANVAEITADLGNELADIDQQFPGVSISFEGQQKETRESMGSLFTGFPVALLLIFALVAMLFGSYLQPIIVMAIIPYSIVGAILGHYIMGFPFTLLSMIGSVALAGIVVNDSLILVDKVNNNRKEGMPLFEAVVMGARSRLRAILLTTITTAAGLFPLLLERSFQAQFLIPMGVSIVFGLIFATALTLLVLPTFYLIFEDLRLAGVWLRTGHRGDPPAAPIELAAPSGPVDPAATGSG